VVEIIQFVLCYYAFINAIFYYVPKLNVYFFVPFLSFMFAQLLIGVSVRSENRVTPSACVSVATATLDLKNSRVPVSNEECPYRSGDSFTGINSREPEQRLVYRDQENRTGCRRCRTQSR